MRGRIQGLTFGTDVLRQLLRFVALMARALVTGGAGFIGSHIVNALLARGEEVTVLDDFSSGYRELVPGDVRLLEGSVLSLDELVEAMRPSPDHVLHLAALFANQNSVEHPVDDLRANAEGTLRVLDTCARCGVKKVVNVSSSCVYGAKQVMREEDRDVQLDTPYAISKLAGEHYAKFWADHWNLDVVSVRPFNAYGPHEWPGRYRNVVPNFFDRAIRGEPLSITGTGDETRDFTFVADTAAGIIAALDAATIPGDVINIGTGRETRIADLARRINELCGNAAGIELIPRRSWDHITRRVGDVSKARRILRWEAHVSLDDGLAQTYEWLQSMLT